MSLMSMSQKLFQTALRIIPRSKKCIVSFSNNTNSTPAIFSQKLHAVVGRQQKSLALLGLSCRNTSTKLIPCGCCGIHNSGGNYSPSSGDSELLKFLDKEIQYEKQQQRKNSPQSKIGDFTIETNGAEMTFSKQNSSDEQILVTVNVNNAYDAAPSFGKDAKDESDEHNEDMACQPSFVVDMKKKGQTLSLTCSFNDDSVPQEEGEITATVESYADLITIDEVCLHDGEWNEKTYHVSTAIMDENLYDHLIRRLEEQGINDQFINDLVDVCTTYEHSLYLKFLQGVQSYIKE